MTSIDKHTYKDISPETLTGVSGGSVTSQQYGEDIRQTLFYVLGMNFLSTPIPGDVYHNDRVHHFCQQLVAMFSGETIPFFGPKWTEGDQTVVFEHDRKLNFSQKKKIHDFIKQQLGKYPSFDHDRTYYILCNGLYNLEKAHKTIDARGKDNLDERITNPYGVSLASFQTKSLQDERKAGEVIPDELAMFTENKRISAEENSLRNSFGYKILDGKEIRTFDQYIARLAYFGHDIREQYNIELLSKKSKPWKLAILASLIAYQTTDQKEFYRMNLRKTGHIKQISQKIRQYNKKNTQTDLIMSEQNIIDTVWYTFNYRLIESLQKFFYKDDIGVNGLAMDDEYAQQYKDVFYDSLSAAHNFDLTPEYIDDLIEIEQVSATRVNEIFKNDTDESLQWTLIELQKYNFDYGYIADITKLKQEEIFKYSDDALIDYIDESQLGLLTYIAIWLYIFNTESLLDFSKRYKKYSHELSNFSSFGYDIESILDETYQTLKFSETYSKIEIQALMVVVHKRITMLRTIIANTEDIHSQHIESYETEYELLLSCLDIFEHPEKETRDAELISKYMDLIDEFRSDFDENEDEDDDMTY